MKRLHAFLFFALFLTVPALKSQAQAPDAETKKKERTEMINQIKKAADAIDLDDLLSEMFEEKARIAAKEQSEGVPVELIDGMMDRLVERFDTDEFIEEVIYPVISDYFSLSEVTMISDFVQSDLGQKIMKAQMGGSEDVRDMMTSGEISQEEMMELMKLYMALGPKKDALGDGQFAEDFQLAARNYGERLMMEVMTEMIGSDSE